MPSVALGAQAPSVLWPHWVLSTRSLHPQGRQALWPHPTVETGGLRAYRTQGRRHSVGHQGEPAGVPQDYPRIPGTTPGPQSPHPFLPSWGFTPRLSQSFRVNILITCLMLTCKRCELITASVHPALPSLQQVQVLRYLRHLEEGINPEPSPHGPPRPSQPDMWCLPNTRFVLLSPCSFQPAVHSGGEADKGYTSMLAHEHMHAQLCPAQAAQTGRELRRGLFPRELPHQFSQSALVRLTCSCDHTALRPEASPNPQVPDTHQRERVSRLSEPQQGMWGQQNPPLQSMAV